MNYKKQIKNRGLKITWIAKQLGVSQPFLSLALNGDRTLTPAHELKLKEILK